MHSIQVVQLSDPEHGSNGVFCLISCYCLWKLVSVFELFCMHSHKLCKIEEYDCDYCLLFIKVTSQNQFDSMLENADVGSQLL